MANITHRFLCVYGHFYQPLREDPFTGHIPHEPGAAPYDNFNEKITAECYLPNAESGNFEAISFDVGPTLAIWLKHEHPDVYRRIVEADHSSRERNVVGNALAQTYFHTILPLANARDKRTQVIWGLTDFAAHFGHSAEGMWLAETAVDLDTLNILADQGVRYTVLAPWQAAEPIDPTEPYLVELSSGRNIAVFFFNGPLSTAVSFNERATVDADRFAREDVIAQLNPDKESRGEDQLIVVATDGELYGHHKPFRDRFLSYLTQQAAPARGFEVTSLGWYLSMHPPKRTVKLTIPTSWSCPHGVSRWSTGCSCTEGSSAWKPALRAAFQGLSERLDDTFERFTANTPGDPWVMRDNYLALRPREPQQDFSTAELGPPWQMPDDSCSPDRMTLLLLEAQYYGQRMFTSCGWFFDDLDGIESRNNIASARKAISLVWRATGIDLQRDFVTDLAAAKSWRKALTGADLYLQLPRLAPEQLPQLGHSEDTPAA